MPCDATALVPPRIPAHLARMARTLSPLAAMLAPARPALALGAGLAALASLLWLGQAAALAAAIAGLLAGETGTGRPALVFLALAALRAGLNHRAEARLFAAAETVTTRTRDALVAREARATGGGAAGGPGAMAALAVDALGTLHPYLTRYAPARARTLLGPPLILLIALWQSWAVALVLLAAGPLIPVFMALVGWAARDASARQLQGVAAMGDLMVDRLAALPDVRLLDAGARLADGFAAAAEDLRARSLAVLRLAFLSSAVLELFAALGVAMVAVWVGFSLLGVIGWGTWGAPLTPFSGLFLLLLAPDFFQPLRDLAAAWHDKAAAEAAAAALAAWDAEDRPSILGAGGAAAPLPGPATIGWQDLRLRGIRFPDARIAPGALVAITGSSGAGKSTLLRLVAGLEAPAEGRIEVAGCLLDDRTADGWRARLGWMPQSPLFAEESLARIIAGDARPDPALLGLAGLDRVLARLPQGLATVPGETGAGLSGGEARRVLLARLLHQRPEVVLADEPTADLDAETADAVTRALLALAERGATLLIATHDARLIARLDREIAL